MSKTLLAKYYEENKERLQKKPAKDIKNFLNQKKQSRNTVLNVTKISQRWKTKAG